MKKTPYTWFGFGRHIFEFYQLKDGRIYLSVCNWLHKHEAGYAFKTIDELKQLVADEMCALRFYLSNNEVTEHNWTNNILPCLNKHNVFETK